MNLNRRSMLQASVVGAVSLGLSGCSVSGTTIVFVNKTDYPLSVQGSLSKTAFIKYDVQPGHSATQLFISSDPFKSVVPASGVVSWVSFTQFGMKNGVPVIIIDDARNTDEVFDCTIGMTNTFTFTVKKPTSSYLDNYLDYTSKSLLTTASEEMDT